MYLVSYVARSRLFRFRWLFIPIVITLIIVHQPIHNKSKDNHSKFKIYPNHSMHIEQIGFSTNSISIPKQLYYVNSARCKIPYIDPFEPEVMEDYEPMTFETCSNESDLIRPMFDMNLKRYVLNIDENVARTLLDSEEVEYKCYYQEIRRQVKRDSYEDLLPRVYFSQGYIVPHHVEGMIVSCYETANASNVIQRDAFTFVQYKPLNTTESDQQIPRKPSVIMFGIDTMSRINLRRTMPKVFEFVSRSGWYEMQGYNKVGDNSFPNLLALLSGYSPESVKEKLCDTDDIGCFDRVPFIWKDFKNAGYLTALAEDMYQMSTFNYLKPGFVEQPTDYYFRPFMEAFEREMSTWMCKICLIPYCMGRRIPSSYIYDFARELIKRYINERPIWSLIWSNHYSHDSYKMPSQMDDFVLQYLQDFEDDGLLKQSIVIFFSDHGARFGPLLTMSSAFFEERLPMLFIYLPPWFRAQYPEYAHGLELNRNRLTSNYDLHNTLKHIIELCQPPRTPLLVRSNDCPRCRSLFHPVEERRDCEDAAIPEHYCTCKSYKRISADWASRIAPSVIIRINEYLWERNFSSLCANLSLNYIHKTEIEMGPDLDFNAELPTIDVANYRTKFNVRQNGADFFATVMYDNVTNEVDVDVETISRTNSYAEDATCLDDKIGKLYCICIDKLES